MAFVEDMSMTPDQINDETFWRMRDLKAELPAITDGGERARTNPEKWDPKKHCPVQVGQIVQVEFDGWSYLDKKALNGKSPDHELEFAIDFMDATGSILLRFGIHTARTAEGDQLVRSSCTIVCNSYDASAIAPYGRANQRGDWGEAEVTKPDASGLWKALLDFAGNQAGAGSLPHLQFELKDDCWEISAVKTGKGNTGGFLASGTSDHEDKVVLCTFKHRSVLGSAPADPSKPVPATAAVKPSANCDDCKVHSIGYEDTSEDTLSSAFKENKLMRLKPEFWSHDATAGLNLLDGVEKVEKSMFASFMGGGDDEEEKADAGETADDGGAGVLALEDGQDEF